MTTCLIHSTAASSTSLGLRNDLFRLTVQRSGALGSRAPLPRVPRRRSVARSAAAAPPVLAFLKGPGAAWWKAPNKPANMTTVSSVQQLVDELDAHKDCLVVVEFFGTWCGACKALLPMLIKQAEADPSVHWITIDYDENKSLGRNLGVTGLPSFRLFQGSLGIVDEVTITPARLGELTDAIERHSTQSGGASPAAGPAEIPPLPGFLTVKPRRASGPGEGPAAPAGPPVAAQQAAEETVSNVVELPAGQFSREAVPAEC